MAKQKAEKEVEIVTPVEDIKLTIETTQQAYVRPLPNHNVKSCGRLVSGKRFVVINKVVGSFVANSNLWYEIDGGYIHASYVTEL